LEYLLLLFSQIYKEHAQIWQAFVASPTETS